MLRDSVLRCLTPVKFKGETFDQIFDAVREDDAYLIVLEWGTPDENQSGIAPKQYVVIPDSEIETEEAAMADYELVSRTGIDFDAASFTDVASVAARLFQRRPQD
jgi:hypothetical protein